MITWCKPKLIFSLLPSFLINLCWAQNKTTFVFYKNENKFGNTCLQSSITGKCSSVMFFSEQNIKKFGLDIDV